MEHMSTLTMAASWMGFIRGLFVVLFILSCILLICVVLLQKGRGGGLSSAFGGAMGSSPFGTKTGDVFTWITVVLSGLFLGAALVLNIIYKPEEVQTGKPAQAAQTGPQEPGASTGTGQEERPGGPITTPGSPLPFTPGPEGPEGTQSPTTQPETPGAGTAQPPGGDGAEATVPIPPSGSPTTQPDE